MQSKRGEVQLVPYLLACDLAEASNIARVACIEHPYERPDNIRTVELVSILRIYRSNPQSQALTV